jgi:acetyltransferase-like isoleucine patch superfamily enzyme
MPRGLAAEGPARPVTIGRNVWIGFDACVLPGVTIGEGAIVGARSVVAADVEPFTIVAGNPARVVRKLTAEERRHGA